MYRDLQFNGLLSSRSLFAFFIFAIVYIFGHKTDLSNVTILIVLQMFCFSLNGCTVDWISDKYTNCSENSHKLLFLFVHFVLWIQKLVEVLH